MNPLDGFGPTNDTDMKCDSLTSGDDGFGDEASDETELSPHDEEVATSHEPSPPAFENPDPRTFREKVFHAILCMRNAFFHAVLVTIAAGGVGGIMIHFCLVPFLLESDPNTTTFDRLSRSSQIQYVAIDYNLASVMAFSWVYVLVSSCLHQFDNVYRRILAIIVLFGLLTQMFVAYAQHFLGVTSTIRAAANLSVFVVALFVGFALVHHGSRRNNPLSKWFHIPCICACFMFELGYAGVVGNVISYTTSPYFRWTSPFLFAWTAWLTRYASENTTLEISAASKLSCLSSGFSCLFSRIAQSVVIDDIEMFLILEVWYDVLNIVTRVTLFYRHALVSYWLSGKCKLRPTLSTRGRQITARCTVAHCIFDFASFLACFSLRYSIGHHNRTVGEFIALFFGCVALQMGSTTMTMLLVTYFEHVPEAELNVALRPMRKAWHTFTYYSCTAAGALTYMINIAVVMWVPATRLQL